MNTNKFNQEELDAVSRVLGLEDVSATSGNETMNLESELSDYFGGGYAIAMNSGTSTLHTALAAIGVGEGDEVISPAFTVIMNTAVTISVGAIPVFVDVDPETFNMDPVDLEKKITPKTKAIQVVSVYGLSPEYDEIMRIANKYSIPVIEDNAECIGGKYKGELVGNFGLFNSLSFEDTKHISCGEGGALLTKCPYHAERARKFAGHGFRTLSARSGQIRLDPKEWQSPLFERHQMIGYNYRLTEIQSAIARVQLTKLDNFLLKWRLISGKEIETVLDESGFFDIQKTENYIEHAYWAVGAKFRGSLDEWFRFRDQLYENCGERVFGAWRVPYNEPVIKDGLYKHAKIHKHFSSLELNYAGSCPNAEAIQAKMMVFKTKYRNREALDNFINGLKRTINEF
jgi:perosamine synthetase